MCERSIGVTLVYPDWGSINAIESRTGADDTQAMLTEVSLAYLQHQLLKLTCILGLQWLMYWLVYALFNLIESPLWIVFQW